MADIVEVVRKSSQTGVNLSQLVGDDDGNVIVPTYDWKAFLGQAYRIVVGLKRTHHFSVTASDSGTIVTSEYCDSDSVDHSVLRGALPAGMPAVITPAGLDHKRKQYLFKEIREFCSEETKDVVCPRPDRIVESSSDEDDEPVAKLARTSATSAAGSSGDRGRGRGKGRGRGLAKVTLVTNL